MISKSIEQALNNQIAEEAYASYYYLAMASWCDKSGLPGSAKFLYAQSEEEREHMTKLFIYINETGGHAITPSIKQPPLNYKSVEEIIHMVLEHERDVTKSINNLVDLCLKEKDYSTFHFLQWYVAEQHEEERLFTALLDKIKTLGGDKGAMYWIDKELAAMGNPRK
jgi:ferritin